jgi:hypothetical protein
MFCCSRPVITPANWRRAAYENGPSQRERDVTNPTDLTTIPAGGTLALADEFHIRIAKCSCPC